MTGRAYPALVSPATDGAWVGVAGVAISGIITIAGTAADGRIALRTTKTTIEGENRQRPDLVANKRLPFPEPCAPQGQVGNTATIVRSILACPQTSADPRRLSG